MNEKYVSDDLFHFVGQSHPSDDEANYDTLLLILNSTCISHPPHDHNFNGFRVSHKWWADVKKGELLIPEVTCFCDIPREALGIHIKKYGKFGISFPKRHLTAQGARPVSYVPLQPSDPRSGWGSIFGELMIDDWQKVWWGFYKEVVEPLGFDSWKRTLGADPQSDEEAIKAAEELISLHFFGFLKAFDADLDENDPNNFYMEREWRKLGNFHFEPAQVCNVLIPESFVDRLRKDLPIYADRILVV